MLRIQKPYVVMAMFSAAATLLGTPALYAAVTVGGLSSSPYIWANPFANPYG